MLLIIWALVGILLGLCLIIVVPWTAARIAGEDWIEAVSGRYVWFAQTAARRSALIVRDGDVKLVPKRYDSDHKADKDTSTGDPRHHRDEFDIIGRLKNKVFGIGLTSRDTYISPLLAELGEEANRAIERNEIGRRETRGQKTTDKMVDGIHIPKRSQLVNLESAKYLTTGASEPESGQEAYKKTKISQEKFHERVSFGQGLLIILAAIGSIGVTWFAASRGGGAGGGGTTVSILAALLGLGVSPDDDGDEDEDEDEDDEGGFDLAAAGKQAAERIGDLLQRGVERTPWPKVQAVLWIVAWLVGIPLIAALTYGLVTALIVSGLMVATALVIAGGIALMAASIPASVGIPLARGFWILAQLTVGRGVLVERDSGELEHRQLRDAPETADHDFEATLSDGKILEIDGSKGDLIRFAWAPIAATAEKSEENMGTITEDIPPQAATDGGEVMPNETRQGYQPAVRVADDDGFLVTMPQLWTLCEGTCESTSVRQGRNKALTEHGGQQQISMVVFSVILLATIVIGGFFGLIAGGAIL